MSDVNISISGIYKLTLTEQLLSEAFLNKFEGIKIPFWRKNKIKKQIHDELESVVLVELSLSNFDDSFNINSFHQSDNDQVPYDVVYLNEEGNEILSRDFVVPAISKMRVCFFLHYFDK